MALTKTNARSGYSVDLSSYATSTDLNNLTTGVFLQAKSMTFEPSGTYDVSVSSDSYADSTFGYVSITPIAANSKIYVQMSGWAMHVNPSASNKGGNFKIYRSVAGGSYGPVTTNSNEFIYQTDGNANAVWNDHRGDAVYLDSPSYTLGDEIRYKLYGRKASNTSNTRFYHSGGHTSGGFNTIHFTAFEIAS